MPLTADQLRSFAADGFLVVHDLITPAVLAGVRARIDELRESAVAAKSTAGMKYQLETGGSVATAVKPALRKLDEPAKRDAVFRSIAETPAILDIVAELTGGPHVLLYSDQVFMKPAFCGSEKPLHQDNSYFKVTPHSAGITCWIAIDDATTENGCLHYIPGSHRFGLVKHRSVDENSVHLTPEVDHPLPPEIAVPVPAGSCIFHHLLAMHSSKANASAHPRRAYALHYANRCVETSVRPLADMITLR
jgi:ectoine hydroxylase-related dioxygenase (phytanoyl-CoA dioxygenase family)